MIFHTGLTDIDAAVWLNDTGRGDRDWPDDQVAEEFLGLEPIQEAVEDLARGGATPPRAPDGVSLPTADPEQRMDPAEVGLFAVRRVVGSLSSGADLADHYDVAPFWFWEPTRLSRPPVEGDPVEPGDDQLARDGGGGVGCPSRPDRGFE